MPSIIPNPQNLQPAEEPRVPLGFGEAVKTAFESTAMQGPLFGFLRMKNLQEANQIGTMLPHADAKKQAEERGYSDLKIPKGGISDIALEQMIENARQDAEDSEKLQRAGMLGQGIGMLSGSMADPVGGALNFVPIFGQARTAKILANASVKAGVLGRIGARLAMGGVEGAAGGLITAPINAFNATGQGRDYTIDDLTTEVVSSAVLGAGMSAVAGAIGEGVAKLADRSSSQWIKKTFGTESQEWAQMLAHDEKVRAESEPIVRESLDEQARASEPAPETVKEPASEPVAAREPSAPGVEPIAYRAARGWAGAPFKRQSLEVVSGLRSALGDRPMLREAAARSDAFAIQVADAFKANEGAVVKIPQAFEPIARAADAIVVDRGNSLTLRESLENGTGRNLSAPEKVLAEAFYRLDKQPERAARFVREFGAAMDRTGSAQTATESAVRAIEMPEGPTERGRIASDATLQNAEHIAMFQALNGTKIDAETMIGADPAIGDRSISEVQKSIQKTADPLERYDAKTGTEAIRDADGIPIIEDLDEAAEQLANDAEAEYKRITEATDTVFSRGADGAGISREQVRADLVSRFGEDLVALGEANGVEIVPSWRDIPVEGLTPDTIAAVKGGKTWISAEGLPANGAPGVYLHEMGVHVGLPAMLGERGFSDLMEKMGKAIDSDPTLARIVDRLVPDDTPTAHIAEERAAYLVQAMEGVYGGREWPEGAQWLNVTDPKTRAAVVELVRDLVAKVKAWAYEKIPGLRDLPMDERDFHALAVRALQHGANADRVQMFAKKAKEAEDMVAQAREASKRARSSYKKALDAIAAIPEADDATMAAAAKQVGDLTQAEADGLVQRFREAKGDIVAAQKKAQADADVQRLRAVHNAIKLHEGLRFMSGWKDDPVMGLLSLDAGSFYNVPGARRSMDSKIKEWQKVLCNGAEAELRRLKLWDKIRDKAFNRQLAHALYDLQTNADLNAADKIYNADHIAAAKTMLKYQKIAMSAQRRFGVESGILEGRILEQSHDQWALRNAANKKRTGATRSWFRDKFRGGDNVKIGDKAHMEQWKQDAARLFDDVTYDGREVTPEYLEATFQLLAGYKVPRERDLLGGQYRELPGEAFRISNRSRKLKPRGPDEWVEYQEKYGNANFLESFMSELQSAARSLGTMEVYGPGAEYTRAAIHAAVGVRLVGMDAAKFQAARNKLENQWKAVTGMVNIPANEMIASVDSGFRSLLRMGLMGSATLSQVSDFTNIARMRALRFNRGAAGIWGEQMAQLGDFLRAVKAPEQRKALLDAWGADMDATVSGLVQRYEAGDAGGFLSDVSAKVFVLNGMNWLTRNNKHGAILGFAHFMAGETRKAWEDMEPTFREYLQQYDVKPEEWEFIRKSEQIAEDGRSYVTPEGLAKVSDEDILAHLESQGFVWNKNRDGSATIDEPTVQRRRKQAANQYRRDIQNKMIGLASDFVNTSMKEPGADARRVMTQGTQAGTALGVGMRMFMTLKSFAISSMMQDWQIEMHGRSTDPRAKVRAFEKSHFVATANTILALTAAGYVSYMLKGWARGITRPSLAEKEGDEDRALLFDIPGFDDRVLIASLMQGGALGIYGDFLLGEQNRMGGGLLATMSGPQIATLEQLFKVYTDLRTKGINDPGRLGNEVANLGKKLIPGVNMFSNLWYSRAIMDQLLWYRLQESINPGAIDRLERNAESRGESYIFAKPSSSVGR